MKNVLSYGYLVGLTFALAWGGTVWAGSPKGEESGEDETATCPCSYDEDELASVLKAAKKKGKAVEKCTSGDQSWGKLTVYAVGSDYGLVAKWDSSGKQGRGQCSTDKGAKNPDSGLKNFGDIEQYEACVEAIQELAGDVACEP